MRIVFLGAGNLATHLSVALHKAGQNIVQVFSRTQASAQSLAQRVGASYTTKASEISQQADLYIFAMTDKANIELATQCNLNNKLSVHTAGSLPASIFEAHTANFGVFYPLQTFSKQREINFSDIPLCLEANTPDNLATLKELAGSISPKVYEIGTEERKRLHIAAVFACNFANHLWALSEEILRQNDLDFSLLHPLIEETTRKALQISPRQAQTGPAVRFDKKIIENHLNFLSFAPKKKELYWQLSESIYRFQQKKD